MSTLLRPDPVEHTVLAADGTRLHAVTAGPRDPRGVVVLVHGVTMAIPFWHRQIEALSDELLVIAFDQRGHGKSGRPGPSGISLDALAADVEAVVDALAPVELPTTLVGHSMGGIAIMGWAARTARRRPINVRGVVLINTVASHILDGATSFIPPRLAAVMMFGLWPAVRSPLPLSPRSAPALAGLLDLLVLGPDRTPPDLALTSRLLRATHPRSRAAFLRFLAELDAESAAAHLDLPTVVIGGRSDRITPPAAAARLVELVPHAALHLLDRCGHQGPLEAGERVNAVIRNAAQSSP
jgi:pimeloyl-ACP methyl ester carboxylesterase